MNKPVSKHALRKALKRAMGEGLIELTQPREAVVDRLWHDLSRQAFSGSRRKRNRPRPPAVEHLIADGAAD